MSQIEQIKINYLIKIEFPWRNSNAYSLVYNAMTHSLRLHQLICDIYRIFQNVKFSTFVNLII